MEVPAPVADAIRELAARQRTSRSAVTTQIVCKALDLDPETFYLPPLRRGPRKRPAKVHTIT